MAGMLDTVRDYAQSHPISVAAGLMIALPGTYMFIRGKSITCAVGVCNDAPSPSHPLTAGTTRGLSVYDSQHPLDLRLKLPTSKWSDKPAPTFFLKVFNGTRKNILSFLVATGERLGFDFHHVLGFLEDRWAADFSLSRFVSVAFTTALPGAFLVFIGNHPGSWAARHQSQVANALHVLALVTVANRKISIQDLLVTAFVMVSFEAFQRCSVGASKEAPSAVETLLVQTHSVVAESDIVVPVTEKCKTIGKDTKRESESVPRDPATAAAREEMVRLQKALTEVKASDKEKEIHLKRTETDLQNARETLNKTLAEYSSLRDDTMTMKQTMARDHQAIVYRKDVELFALQKANEQKENYMKERGAKLDEIYRQQTAALELKDAQLRNLQERVAFLEQGDCNQVNGEPKVESQVDGDHQAVQIKLLRVKGRNSLEADRPMEDKDVEIAKLKGELAAAANASETHEHTKDELRRAWDATYEVQNALSDERQHHAQTQAKLKEVTIRLDEELKSREKDSPTRLPIIEEQDKKELEAMFNAAQEDNLKLYSDIDVLDKRLREANARVFASDQEVEALREQLRLEKAITEDMETARPSLVHRVHFQRMEGQLKESRDALEKKEDEIERLKRSNTAKDGQFEDLKKAAEQASRSHTQLQDEHEQLKKSVAELESTKKQLMLDHERLAQHKTRQRDSSAEHTSARSSGATLITDSSIHAVINSEPPLPARPVTVVGDSSIRSTPEGARRVDTNRVSMISNDVPPSELRSPRRKSLTLKGLMRKITKKDPETESNSKLTKEETKEREKEKAGEKEKEKEEVKAKAKEKERERGEEKEAQRPKTALAPKDKNTIIRPKTAVVPESVAKKEKGKEKEGEGVRPKTAVPPMKGKENQKTQTPMPTRYYSAQVNRPKTAVGVAGAVGALGVTQKENGGLDASSQRPKSRGWSTSRKLARKSMG